MMNNKKTGKQTDMKKKWQKLPQSNSYRSVKWAFFESQFQVCCTHNKNLTHQKCLKPSTFSVREDFKNKTNRFARTITVKYYIRHFKINGCHHTKYEVKILFNSPSKPNFMTVSNVALSRTVNNM